MKIFLEVYTGIVPWGLSFIFEVIIHVLCRYLPRASLAPRLVLGGMDPTVKEVAQPIWLARDRVLRGTGEEEGTGCLAFELRD